jgi:DNA-binding CsgD family transcriptional regulator/PAS domain-containing protein
MPRPGQDDILKAIESVYAAALAPEDWIGVLEIVAALFGGVAGVIELVDKRTMSHRWFRVCRMPPLEELRYIDEYLALSPRVAHGFGQPLGKISYDHMILTEAQMDRDPFYAEFLPQTGFYYFVGGVLTQTEDVLGAFSVQRSRAQGHVGRAETELMATLLPHVRRAVDITLRCEALDSRERALDNALDWLDDGALLLRADGSIAFANDAARTLLACGDGLRIAAGRLECGSLAARDALATAFAAAARVALGESADDTADLDCPVPRPSGATPYLVSLRPLDSRSERWTCSEGAILIAFIRDPAAAGGAPGALLRRLYGLTEAEAGLALALQAGCSPPDYARRHRLSLNTVYTHLRRLREKTGCPRQAELVRLLDDLRVPLRAATGGQVSRGRSRAGDAAPSARG